MNRLEREALDERAACSGPPVSLVGTAKWVGVWFVGFVLCVFGLFVLVCSDVTAVIGGILGGVLAIFAIICLYAIIMLVGGHRHWSRVHRHFVRHRLPDLRKALEDGMVFVKRVSATAVIEVAETEDEGSGCIYDVGDGKILFLKGQEYYPEKEEMAWPNSEFEIVRTVQGAIWVGIFCSGGALAPLSVIETSECVDDIVWAEREELRDGDIEQFAASIMKAGRKLV